MALLSLFFCFYVLFFFFARFVPVPVSLSLGPLCASMLRRSHLFGVDYFPRIGQSDSLRLLIHDLFLFHFINEDGWMKGPMCLGPLMTYLCPSVN